MNFGNLHELINRYEAHLDKTMGSEHREQFKWEAVKVFRDVWFSDEAKTLPFSEMFNRARKGCGFLTDTSRTTASSGVVKIAEQKEDEVASLFRDVLYADDHGDLVERQKHMDDFVDQFEILRQQTFPKYWKYKNDRHTASCYLSFYDPEHNFIYRYTEAEIMARYIEFDQTIGSGRYFSLPNYYRMCEIIVEALKEHPSLLETHKAYLNPKCYPDDSLHLMAFDLMYCCRCYGYYKGMSYNSFTTERKSTGKKNSKASQEIAENRTRQLARLADLQEKLLTCQTELADYELISLIGTAVTYAAYGTGTIVEQEENKITVRFENIKATFKLHRKYLVKPTIVDG